MYRHFLKRLFDVILSLILLLLLSPFLLLISIIILIKMGSPVFFIQKRPGLNNKIFSLIKFRSMKDKKDSDGRLASDSERMTGLGAILRKSSIDELPELFNILKGDMSFVGPRPLLIEYLPYYTEEEKIRHTVRPGLTGLAQVTGRHTLNWDERLKLDQQYVRDCSLSLDIKILFQTAVNVIRMKDVEAVPAKMSEKFSELRKKE